MNKIFLLCCLILFIITSGNGQEQDMARYPGKDQSKLPNDVNISYGLGTAYLFLNEIEHDYKPEVSSSTSERSDISSPGSLMIGYNRMINKAFMIGFLASWVKTHYKQTYRDSADVAVGEATFTDNLLSGYAKVSYNYVNKPKVRVYSAAAVGMSIDLSAVEGKLPQAISDTERKILFAGQVTFMGIRFGRTFGGFMEFGFGTNAIISAGLNYQFGD